MYNFELLFDKPRYSVSFLPMPGERVERRVVEFRAR